ncbi:MULTISPECIES: hypothetical protein [Vibrio harveyi group]|uniref:hypothetical protein n=1 Tax=Vibrio harveyi group TaxID=717610 RepID=UPI001B81C0DF|nr:MULTISPECIES: hypothetical protein [Vibrio harveyi group]MCR9515644.1 hypothetical protein [Vibrio alginolyticus]MCR9728609.1 hypothetical protein [Vibrio parahaemolyticus]MCR9753263.1 hypothetical protein [Vibrio parahaemolyticus]MCR9787839.1 hypothetical protein [Vibrio parahaemolyticus]MCR9863261.1 hypothetical protein [Vibrio parahaemolyticus]
MAKFNSETASTAGSKSKRGKAKTFDIDTLAGDELLRKSLTGEFGAVVQRQVLLLAIQSHLKSQERLSKQKIDEENMVSASYLRHLSRAEIEAIMENGNAQGSQSRVN